MTYIGMINIIFVNLNINTCVTQHIELDGEYIIGFYYC